MLTSLWQQLHIHCTDVCVCVCVIVILVKNANAPFPQNVELFLLTGSFDFRQIGVLESKSVKIKTHVLGGFSSVF